ncbi:MAG: efflux RND transporter permease subunit [Cyanobacteria bacterium J06627_28]
MTTEYQAHPVPEMPAQKASTASKTEESQIPRWMNFFFIRQIFATLLCALLLLGGIVGYVSMVKEGEPDINIARARITTRWGGTDVETLENQVTNKLETEIRSLQGLDNLTSATFNSSAIIDVSFRAEAPISESIQALRGKVDDAESELPDTASGREVPDFQQLSAQDAPVLTLALVGEGLDETLLGQAAEALQERLEAVSNVREVNLAGQRDEVVHVQLLPSRLTTLGISATQVESAIQTGNTDVSWDLVRDDDIGAQVRLYGRFRTLDDLRSVPVARLDENRVVRLAEVAEVFQGPERETSRAFLSWQGDPFTPTVTLDVVKAAGSDTIQVVDDTLAALEAARQDLQLWPYGMDYRVLNDDSASIKNELGDLVSNVLQASLCVFAILFIALTWREAVVAGLAIPMTFAGAVFVLWMMGYTLNSMVMVGMILALGLLVDVFILMLEGLHEGLFVEKLTFAQSAIKTVRSYGVPAFAGQLTTILAMAPLMAISGTLGQFIRLIPISAITCLVLSYVLALLAVIPLSKFLLDRPGGFHSKTLIDRLTETGSARFAQWTLNNTVANRRTARRWTLGSVALFVASLILFAQLTVSLFPASDRLKLSINVELPPAATLARSQEVADRLGKIVRSYRDFDSAANGEPPLFASVVKLVGQRSNLVSSGELKPSSADYVVGLSAVFTERSLRSQDSFTYLAGLRQTLEDQVIRDYPGAVLSLQYERAGGSEDPIQVEIYGDDLQTLRQISSQVQQALREIPGTMDVRDDLGNLRDDYKLVPKREALDFYGIGQDDLGAQGRYLLADNAIGDFAVGDGEEDLEIRLSTQWPSQRGDIGGPTGLDEFATLRFVTPQGQVLSGDALLARVPDAVPLSITHRDAQRSVTVLAKTIPGSDTFDSDVLAALRPKLEALQYDPSSPDNAERWPSGYTYRFGGDADTTGETFSSAGQMLVIAIFLVFAVLVLQFGSYTQPFIIMMTIPFALIGTFFGLFLLGESFSFPVAIGVIALTGIVVNDAIVMVETMNERRREGWDVRHAAAQGASDRLRPILTTSITTVAGLVPLALSSAQWFPLCMAIVFGLVSATAIALLVVPGLYLQLTSNIPELQACEAGDALAQLD